MIRRFLRTFGLILLRPGANNAVRFYGLHKRDNLVDYHYQEFRAATSGPSRYAGVPSTEAESKPALHGMIFVTVSPIRKCEARFQVSAISQLLPWSAPQIIRLAAFSARSGQGVKPKRRRLYEDSFFSWLLELSFDSNARWYNGVVISWISLLSLV